MIERRPHRSLALIAAAFLALAIRGLAPVAAWGGWTSLLALELFALLACLGAAWRRRREGTGAARRDPMVFLLLAHFPIWTLSYFALGANHGVDAINHIEYVRSAVFDHDLDVSNDDAILGGAPGEHPETDPTQINMHGIGPAFLWAPLYLTAHAFCGVIGQACNGASRPYLAACTLTSMFVSSLGLVFAYRLALRFASRGAAFLGVLGIAWGTFLFWYLTSEPTMSHNVSFASAALTFLLIQRGPRGPLGWFVVGLSIGFSSCVRFANALLGVAALPALGWRREGQGLAPWRNLAALGLGAFVAFLPQMLAWRAIFGSFLLVPNGPGFLDHPPALLGVLFSARGGLFTWSPLLYLALPGLLAFRRLGFRTCVGFWGVIILLYVTNARVPDWWGGSSFGNRRFCTILAPMAVGMAIAIDALSRFVRRHPLAAPGALIAMMSGWNVLLAGGHRDWAWEWGEPASFPQMTRVVVDRIARSIGSPFSLPGAVIESWSSGRRIADYDAALFRRPYSTFVLRFGDGDLPFLGDGFSLPQGTGDGLHRSTRDGTVVVPLQKAAAYTLGLRLRGREDHVLRVEINGAATLACPLERELKDCEVDVSESWLRAGDNVIRLRADPGGSPLPSDVQLHAFWLKPRRGAEAPADAR
ncbi:MAG: hypothetical protein K1Y01_11470 [Vicinamibacteria bacterium]|nr:hypothetical protein [Vicinamibacteria bacterium]